MANDKEIWPSSHDAYTPYPIATYINSAQAADQPYNVLWHQQQCVSLANPPLIPVPSTYNHVTSNVNQLKGYGNVTGLNPVPWRLQDHIDKLDSEVSFYNSFSGFEHNSHISDDNRCSSTDTTVSSVSTVLSHGSIDTDFNPDTEQTGQKRKRQKPQKSKNKKAKKENSNMSYRRWPKPPYSYCGMIIVAIQMSPKKELTLQGIHATLMELFPFFRGSYLGWRDSVRHNLSHFPCFVKIPCIPPNKVGGWKVDWSKVNPAMFARQQSKIGQSDLYEATIHKHLGLEPYCGETYTKEKSSEYENVAVTPRQPKRKKEQNATPQISDTHRFSLALPCVEKCENNSESPCHFRSHVSIPSHSEPRSSDDIRTSSASSTLTRSCGSYPPDFDSFLNMIVSEKRSSLDAAHHLHTLCVPVNQSPLTEAETKLPPLSRDSDVYLPMSPVKSASDEPSANIPNQNLWCSAYAESGLITISPCKALPTSVLSSERDEFTRGSLVLESVMTKPTALSADDSEDELYILDI